MLKNRNRVRKMRFWLYILILATISSVVGVTIGGPSSGSLGTSTEKSFHTLMDEAMSSMDQGMENAAMTGDPDHDFAAMMIPHHQGAIDMAKAELLYGKDPVLRRLAQEIIVTQEQEITVMRTRLKQFKTKSGD